MSLKVESIISPFVNVKNICSVFSTACLVIFVCHLVKIYLSRRHLVKHANNLPRTKLRFYHFLGHANLMRNRFLNKLPPNIPPHVYDFLALNGYNCGLFSEENITILWQFYYPFITVYKADSVEMILNHSTELKKAWFYELLHPWLGTGLLTSHDEKWKKRRKLLTPAFHFNILKDFLPTFNKQSNILTEVLKPYSQVESVDVVPLISRCSLDIISESIMGKTLHTQTQPSHPYVHAVVSLTSGVFERMQRPWLWNDTLFKYSPSGREFSKNIRIVDNFTNELITEKKNKKLKRTRQESSACEDKEVDEFQLKKRALLDLLLDEHIERGSLSEDDIREEVSTFAFEGHDTTSMGMSWSLYLIGLHPWIQDKIHQELDSIFEGDNRDATIEDLKNMKYLECVIKEALRLYPSVPAFARMIREDIEFQGRTVPKGSTVLVYSYLLHRDPKVFPNPEKFDPDRFSPENSAGRHPFAYVPFSAGPRNCIGQRFAVMEMKVVLSSILRRYKIRSLDPIDRVHVMDQLVLRPANGLRIQIRQRDQSFDFHSVYYFP